MSASSSAPAIATSTDTSSVKLAASQSLLLGSLIFGLFFGAGNLIFPVELGRAAGSAALWATLGFLVTAVGLPVVGVISSALSGSSSVLDMTGRVSRWYAIAFTCALYLTIGPLFAIPRTATVSFEVGIAPVLSQGQHATGLALFTVAFFVLTALGAMRPSHLLDVVGRWLTPVFLVLLATVLVAALVRPMSRGALAEPTADYASAPFAKGLLDGYNTMDALASVAFAIVVIDAVRRMGVVRQGRIAVETARSGVVTLVAMGTIYAALAFVGATAGRVVAGADNGGTMLARVSAHYYGRGGQALIAAIVLVACLKTAIGLIAACSEMFSTMFPGVIGSRVWALGFTVVSALIANLGLKAIIAWSIPVLVFLYPLAITAILLGLLHRWVGGHPLVHRLTTALVALAALFDLVKALPVRIPGAGRLDAFASAVLPGHDLGFGWLVPAAVGLVVGWLLSARR